MTEYLNEWLLVCGIVLLAVASPGPDFVMTVRNSMLYGRKVGVFTAIGIGLAILIHVSYCIAGIATIISQSILLFNIIKILGAAYLIYIGIQALRSTGYSGKVNVDGMTAEPDYSVLKALGNGFLTNLLNPKATLFFLSLYTQVIDPQTPLAIQAMFGISAALIGQIWFSCVALFLTIRHIKHAFLRVSKWIDRACGAFLLMLGLKLAFSRSN